MTCISCPVPLQPTTLADITWYHPAGKPNLYSDLHVKFCFFEGAWSGLEEMRKTRKLGESRVHFSPSPSYPNSLLRIVPSRRRWVTPQLVCAWRGPYGTSEMLHREGGLQGFYLDVVSDVSSNYGCVSVSIRTPLLSLPRPGELDTRMAEKATTDSNPKLTEMPKPPQSRTLKLQPYIMFPIPFLNRWQTSRSHIPKANVAYLHKHLGIF